jgi:hypothetical protein
LLTVESPICADEEDVGAGVDLGERGAEFRDYDSFGEMRTGGGENLIVRTCISRIIPRQKRTEVH